MCCDCGRAKTGRSRDVADRADGAKEEGVHAAACRGHLRRVARDKERSWGKGRGAEAPSVEKEAAAMKIRVAGCRGR